jgi:hypothetical protein
VINELDLHTEFARYDPVLVTGSFISGLMVWRDLDVMLLGGPDLSPTEVLSAVAKIVALPGLVGFSYADERGSRSPTGERRDERYHVPMTYVRPSGTWRLDLTFWLHDPHENVAAWHEALRESLTPQQRADILGIKDVWHRRPEYPDTIGGYEIYTAVLDHGVRTPQQFEAWLATAR